MHGICRNTGRGRCLVIFSNIRSLWIWPPYYGQTQNMDKWSDPLPLVIGFDLACLVIAGVFARQGIKRLRTSKGA